MKRLVDVTMNLLNEEDSSIKPENYFNPLNAFIDDRKQVATELLQEGYDVFQIAELCALPLRAVRFLQNPSNVVFVKKKEVLETKPPLPVNLRKGKQKKK
ncbi:hypothetical protein [Priestia megaterium]|uniref:hypothetical protein n=1 Tax=Priestia megaterium TaxID=1404 RepID=UPI00387398F2|nr:hypothetical protein QY062_24595 [Priestia megaterium]